MNAIAVQEPQNFLHDPQNPPSPINLKTPKKEPRYKNTAIIFDWDDTLLSSSMLNQAGVGLDTDDALISDEIRKELIMLEGYVRNLLTLSIELAQVFIITNAEQGWVELSAKKFLPGVLPLLDLIPVFSARTNFEQYYTTPQEWKSEAFATQLRDHFTISEELNVISFGDSESERTALLSLGKLDKWSGRTKSVKFVDRPSCEQLRRQIEMITCNLHAVCRHPGNLDLMLTIFTPVEETQPPSESVDPTISQE